MAARTDKFNVAEFGDGKTSTVLSSAECPSCRCVVVANGFSKKEPDREDCDCRCHESWRFIHHKPVG